jgi:hypothetical protein
MPADYYPLMKRAVDGLPVNTHDSRRILYGRARKVLVDKLRGRNPPMPELAITSEGIALEEAVCRVETEAVRGQRKLKAEAPATKPDVLQSRVGQGHTRRDAADYAARVAFPSVDLHNEMRKDAQSLKAPPAAPAVVANGSDAPLPVFTAETWRSLTARLDQDRRGARVELKDDGLFSFSRVATEADRQVAESRLTQELQLEVQRKASALQSSTIRLSDQPDWSGLAIAADMFADAVDHPPDEIAANISAIWSLSVSLGGYIEHDEDALANGVINSLEADVALVLRDLLSAAATWIRRFPTGEMLDDEARSFSVARREIDPAKEFFQQVVQGKLVRYPDAKAVEIALSVGDSDGTQAAKARAWGVKTVANFGTAIVLNFGGVLFAGSGKETGAGVAKYSIIAQRAQQAVVSGEKALLEILSHLPADIRVALRTTLEAMRRVRADT